MTTPTTYTDLCARLENPPIGRATPIRLAAAAIRELEARVEVHAKISAEAERVATYEHDRAEAAEAKLAEAVKMLDERDREYNRLTNDMIERHAATVATLTEKVEAMRGERDRAVMFLREAVHDLKVEERSDTSERGKECLVFLAALTTENQNG